MESKNKKRSKKAYYKQQFQQSKRGEELNSGINGFLVTCDLKNEQRCIKETYNLLNDAIQILYPDIEQKLKEVEDAD